MQDCVGPGHLGFPISRELRISRPFFLQRDDVALGA